VSEPAHLGQLARDLRAGRCTSAELVQRSLSRAAETAPLNAFVSLDQAAALGAARTADRELASGRDRGPLHGIPVAVKDNICTADLATRCGSRILDGFVPGYDATAVARLREAGAVIVGKTNLDEFGMGSSSETSIDGPVRNPRDPSRVAGGSSGGSAAAVAAGVVPVALGTDTGGSVRQPASLCGVVGLKPSWGRVSRFGLVAFGSSLDQVGPIAGDVEGAALALQVMAGQDARDATSSDRPVPDLAAALAAPAGPLRIGIPRETLDGLDQEPADLLRQALAAAGAEIVEVALPHVRFAVAAYYVLASAEASSNLARFDGIRYGRRSCPPGGELRETYVASRTSGFGSEVKRRIMLGTFALSAGYAERYYGRAQAARRAIGRDFDAALAGVDLLAGMTSPCVAWPLGEKLDDPLAMYLSDVFTIPASLAGLPAISIPVGQDRSGLPWGLQLTGRAFGEGPMVAAAARIEAALGGGA
jgi:aspartyl-tRNA(Asn)/glutamyl-tRNA(Gln) amidotransferase subunit A